MEFDFSEKVELDQDGRPVRLPAVHADQIIEEMMIICNQTVAEHISGLKAPSLYRVHEEPSDRTGRTAFFLAHFGYRLSGVRPPPAPHPGCIELGTRTAGGKGGQHGCFAR